MNTVRVSIPNPAVKSRKRELSVRVRPDAIFTIRFTGRESKNTANFFLEADTGSMAHREFYKKASAYCALYDADHHTKQFGVGEFRVLTATSSPERRDNLKSNLLHKWNIPALRPTAKNIGRFYFADQAEYRVERPEMILSDIFYTLKREEPRSILPPTQAF